MIALVFLVGATLLMAASPNVQKYEGKAYTHTDSIAVLVKWDNGTRAYIDMKDYTEASFTYRAYSVVDSLFIMVFTTDFPDDGLADTVDIANDYKEIFRDTLDAAGISQFVLGKTQATAFGNYVAIKLLLFGAGTSNVGDGYYLRGQD